MHIPISKDPLDNFTHNTFKFYTILILRMQLRAGASDFLNYNFVLGIQSKFMGLLHSHNEVLKPTS